MKKQLLALGAFFLFATTGQAQQEIKMEDLSKHIGDSVTVCTKIYGGIFLDRSKGKEKVDLYYLYYVRVYAFRKNSWQMISHITTREYHEL